MRKIYCPKVDEKIAQKIWDKIRRKIVEEKFERDLNNEKIAFEILYMVYNHGGFWEKKNEKTKVQFISLLKKVYGVVNKKDAGELWNKISRCGKNKILRMMQKCIDISKEISRLGNEKTRIRINAAIKLGILQDKRAIRPLLEALKDRKWEVKIAAAEALDRIGNPRVLDDIRKLLISIEREIKKIDNQINRLEKGKNQYATEIYYQMHKELMKERKIFSQYYERVKKVLENLKKKRFDQLAVLTENKLKEMDWQDFQDRIIEALNGIPSE